MGFRLLAYGNMNKDVNDFLKYHLLPNKHVALTYIVECDPDFEVSFRKLVNKLSFLLSLFATLCKFL